jgi:hypothetical protein
LTKTTFFISMSYAEWLSQMASGRNILGGRR